MPSVVQYMLSHAVLALLMIVALFHLGMIVPPAAARLAALWGANGGSDLSNHGYEQQCADLGFCIVPPPVVDTNIFVMPDGISSWFSLCWVQNGLVWIGLVLSLVLPVVRITFQVLASRIPFLAFFFNGLASLIPDLVTTQDIPCLIRFFYGFALMPAIAYLWYIFVLPLVFCFWRTLILVAGEKRD